jgi:ribosomal protein S18 acetylase RimI-like enzyme
MTSTALAALPEGLTSRPLQQSDARAVYQVMAADQLDQLGHAEIEEADIVGDWARPSFDVAASTMGVFDGDHLVGYAEVTAADRGDAAVHPDYRRRGIGTALAHWMQERARENGQSVIGMPVPEGSHGDRLLAALGYRVRWTSWVLKLPAGVEVAERPLPEGYAVRAATAEEYPACHAVIEDAFLEWSVRDREKYEDFHASVVGRPGFEPWNLRVVTDASGDVVVCGLVNLAESEDDRPAEAFISRLAVRRDQRNRGLAQVLLVDAFAVAREHGAAVSGLSTDSRTGALGLYEKVGMVTTDVWVNRAKDL